MKIVTEANIRRCRVIIQRKRQKRSDWNLWMCPLFALRVCQFAHVSVLAFRGDPAAMAHQIPTEPRR